MKLSISVLLLMVAVKGFAVDPQFQGVRHFAYQIQDQHLGNSLDIFAASHYDLLVIDQTRSIKGEETYNSAADVAALKASYGSTVNPKKVVCYIDVGQAESYRWYWQPGWRVGNPDWIVAPDPDGWDENYQVKFWRQEWMMIMKEFFSRIIADGYDGAYLDWLEVYDADGVVEAAWDEGLDPELALIDFIRELREHCAALDPDFFLIAQNAAEMGAYPEYLDLFAAISQEAIWFDGGGDPDSGEEPGDVPVDPYWTETYLNDLTYWKNAGKLIFNAEYAVDPNNAFGAYQLGKESGFITYVSMRLLNTITTTPPPEYGIRNVTDEPDHDDMNPAFSPDGQWLLFTTTRGTGENTNLWKIRTDSSEAQAITTETLSDNVSMPGTSWSSVTGKICFSSDRDGNDDIYTVNPDGADLTQVTNGQGRNWEPTFSPDGQWIVFQSDRDGDWEIYRRHLVTGQAVQLTNNSVNDWEPNWSPAGDTIVFQSMRTGDWDIFVMDTNGQSVVNLTNHPAEDSDPSFSPDGKWVVYSTDRAGPAEPELYLVNVNNLMENFRLTFNEVYEGAASISPNGRILAFESYLTGTLDLWLYELYLNIESRRRHSRPFGKQ